MFLFMNAVMYVVAFVLFGWLGVLGWFLFNMLFPPLLLLILGAFK